MNQILYAGVAAVALAASAAGQTPYQVGQPLPDLRLPTVDGQQTIDLKDYRGKRLLLIEFAAW